MVVLHYLMAVILVIFETSCWLYTTINLYDQYLFSHICFSDPQGPNFTTLVMAVVCVCGLLLPSYEDTDILRFRISFNLKLVLAFVLGKNEYILFCELKILVIKPNLSYFRYDYDYHIATSIIYQIILYIYHLNVLV